MPLDPAQDVAVPLSPPSPPLADDAVRLEPITAADARDMDALAQDPLVRRFTPVPNDPPPGYGETWAARYVEGWRVGVPAGFVIRDARTGAFLGAAMYVRIDRGAQEGEAGYLLAPAGRGRGVASRALRLLTRWGFDELDLERIELRIDAANRASERVAERCGYSRDGVLRSVAFKGARIDLGVWSRLRSDPGRPPTPSARPSRRG